MILSRESNPQDIAETVDAIVLCGGEDIQPSLYGGPEGAHDTKHDPERDLFEKSLTHAAVDKGIPLLGVCRGSQMINVALGGTLLSHISDGPVEHTPRDADRGVSKHAVAVDPSSSLGAALGLSWDQAGVDTTVTVSSYHHQAVQELGVSVKPVAWAEDGIVEAVEVEGHAILGVQWHPELHDDLDPLFHWLVAQAAPTGRKGRH